MTEWRTYQLGDLGDPGKHAFATGPFGSSISKRFFVEEGVPVIRGSNLSVDVEVVLKDEGLVFVDEERARKFSRSIARTGDLVFTCWGTVGQVGYISDTTKYERYVVSNKQMKMTPDSSRVDALFLYYLLSSSYMVHEVTSQAIGTSVPGFNLGQLKELVVRVPPLSVQKDISRTLRAISSLIENNRRRIEVLEEMARLLFREWFVHFRFPGHEDVELVDSNLGLIPESWTAGEFSDLVSEIRETVPPEEIAAGTPVVGLEHFPRRSTTLHEWENASDVGSRRKVFVEGDILFGKIRPYFHKVVDAPISGCSSTDAIVFRPKEHRLRCRALAVASSDEFVGVATATSNGTKMPRANTEILMTTGVPHPTQDVERAFNETVEPMDSLRKTLAAQSRKLREARDLLLPRLVSGELDVSELGFGLVAV